MKTSTTTKIAYFIFGIFILILIWACASQAIGNNHIIPTIGEVGSKILEILMEKKTYSIIGFTLLKIIITVIISLFIAIILSIISMINYRIEYIIRPAISFMKVVPIVTIAMIILIMFFKQNIRYIGTMVVCSFVVIPIIYEGIMMGFKTIDQPVKDYTRLISDTNLKVVLKVYVPLAFPYILGSIIQSFGLGLKVMVMSEVICNPNDSIGKIIAEYASFGEMGYVFAWSIILIIIVIIFDQGLKFIKIPELSN